MPRAWLAVSPTSYDEAYRALKGVNGALADLVRAGGGPVGPSLIDLLAYDVSSPTISAGFPTNITVAVVPLGGTTSVDAFANDDVARLRAAPGVSPSIDIQRLLLPIGEAALIHAHVDSGSQRSVVAQYLVVRGSAGFVISFSTLPASLAEYAPLFDRIAGTFRFER